MHAYRTRGHVMRHAQEHVRHRDMYPEARVGARKHGSTGCNPKWNKRPLSICLECCNQHTVATRRRDTLQRQRRVTKRRRNPDRQAFERTCPLTRLRALPAQSKGAKARPILWPKECIYVSQELEGLESQQRAGSIESGV